MKQFPTDHFLIQQVLDGQTSEFKTLYKKYSRMIHLVCLRYAKKESDAEDYVQDTFVLVFKNLKSYDPAKGEFATWSKKIAINVCLQHLRKKTFKFFLGNFSDLVSSQSNEPTPLDNLSLEELTKRIQSLPDGYRSVFNMFVIDGYSHKEIANELGITESTSRSQLVKAKKHLQGKLLQQKFEGNYG